ncbi:MAG TPA: NIPSNAP family protein, partial [Chitinophaga sp.]
MKIVTFTMMKSLFLLLLISQMALAQSDKSEAVQQLRIYEIFEHNKAAFHERFDNHAQRIMKKYGFNIIAMWETKTGTKTEFVYLLQWSDVKTLQ